MFTQKMRMSLVGRQEWILAIVLFMMTNPCIVWFTPVPLLSTLLFYYLAVVNREEVQPKLFIGYLLFSLFYILVGLRYGFSLALPYTLLIPLLLLIDKNLLCEGFNKFIILLSIVLTLSLIVYFLVVFLGISLPHIPIKPINPLKEDSGLGYEMYPFLLITDYNEYHGEILQRFCGIYDEPGTVGTINAIILVANNYNLKKRVFIPIFIAGLFSFSLYFFIVSIAFFVIKMRKQNVIPISLFVAIVIYAISFIPGIEDLVFNRFEFEDGEWQGNSRETAGFSQWYTHFSETSDYYFGLGPGANLVYNSGGSSYKDIIVNYGIIMFSLYILSWVVFILRTQSDIRNMILVFFVILGCVFQRPFITNVFMQLSFVYLLFNIEIKMQSEIVT